MGETGGPAWPCANTIRASTPNGLGWGQAGDIAPLTHCASGVHTPPALRVRIPRIQGEYPNLPFNFEAGAIVH